MGVDRPLIRPSTPFGQTSTHRSRKPAPCRALCLPSLFVSFASYPPPPSSSLFHLPLLLLSVLSRSSPPAPLPLPATYPRADTFNLARIPRMHHLFLIVCLTRTHATGGWIQTRITRASIAQVCAHHRVRTCPAYACIYIYIYTILRKRKGRNSIDTGGGTPTIYRVPPFLFSPFSTP